MQWEGECGGDLGERERVGDSSQKRGGCGGRGVHDMREKGRGGGGGRGRGKRLRMEL